MMGGKGTIAPFLWGIGVFTIISGFLYMAGMPELSVYLFLSAIGLGLLSIAGFRVLRKMIVARHEMRFIGFFIATILLDMVLGFGVLYYAIKVLQVSKYHIAGTFFPVFFTFLYSKASGLVYLTNKYHA